MAIHSPPSEPSADPVPPPDAVDHLRSRPRSARDTLAGLRDDDGPAHRAVSGPLRTGFDLVDRVLDGGLRIHDLVLVGGGPGVGKTVAALQMAREAAEQGRTVIYVSFEHPPAAMLGRLLALELGEMATPDQAPELGRLRDVVIAATAGFRSLDDAIAQEPLLAAAVTRIDAYADRLLLVRGSGTHTDLSSLEGLVRAADQATGGVLFVDYLQKVAMQPEPQAEAEKVTRVVEGLKELALSNGVTVVAIAASDWDGLETGRMRLHHLRGSSALVYECDIALILNEKHQAVAREHLVYDTVRAESYKQQVVFTVEKNRGGPAMVDIEHRKDFLHYRFDPRGNYLAERLSDDRIQPA